jgi:cardiolipin synthase
VYLSWNYAEVHRYLNRHLACLGISLLTVTGCTSLRGLPEKDLDTVAPLGDSAYPLDIRNSEGRVDAATRERVTARLAAIGADNLLARQLAAMAEFSPNPLFGGNRVRLLIDGPATYDAMYAAMEQATDSINIETFIFEEALSRGRSFLELIRKKAGAGVRINLLYDAVGSIATPEELFESLRDAGVKTCAFNPLNPLENRTAKFVQRTHRKTVIVDRQLAFSGGLNLSRTYDSSSRAMLSRPEPTLANGWRDTHVAVEGPAAVEIQRYFLESWNKQSCTPLESERYLVTARDAGNTLVRIDASSPDSQRAETWLAALAAVSYAQHSIDITMAYFTPDNELETALRDAAARGVRVRLLLPAFSDFTGVLYAAQSHYSRLLRAGVEIHEAHKVFVHAKTIVVDAIWTTVGTANWDYRSFLDNDELNVVVIDEAFATRMTAVFADDLANALKIDPEEWSRRPLHRRFLEHFWSMWERFL